MVCFSSLSFGPKGRASPSPALYIDSDTGTGYSLEKFLEVNFWIFFSFYSAVLLHY